MDFKKIFRIKEKPIEIDLEKEVRVDRYLKDNYPQLKPGSLVYLSFNPQVKNTVIGFLGVFDKTYWYRLNKKDDYYFSFMHGMMFRKDNPYSIFLPEFGPDSNLRRWHVGGDEVIDGHNLYVGEKDIIAYFTEMGQPHIPTMLEVISKSLES